MGKKNYVVTGRDLLMKRMIMFSTRMGIEIDLPIYIEKQGMEKLMKAKFSAAKLVPRFKDLERGNYILICAPK